jgi:monoamine oxidase
MQVAAALHSADRNPWVGIAERSGFEVLRGPTAWGTQFRGLGFPPEDERAARRAFEELKERLQNAPPPTDRVSDALPANGRWNAFLNAISGFGNGVEFDRISVEDYMGYESASTAHNWRVRAGYGKMIASQMPDDVEVSLGTPLHAVNVSGRRVDLRTSRGTLRAKAVIVTTSTTVLSGSAIDWPQQLSPWQDAARQLPLGNNEELFLEIVGDSDFETETHVIGNPYDVSTGSYYIRPFGMPIIECFLGGAGARYAANERVEAAFALEQLRSLFGSSTCNNLRPLASSRWTKTHSIGGAYSHALPKHTAARRRLATSHEQRVFFAGEATSTDNFSTAHGALQSGIRAAEEFLSVRYNSPHSL